MKKKIIYKDFLILISFLGIILILYFLPKEESKIKKPSIQSPEIHTVVDTTKIRYYEKLSLNKSEVNIYVSTEGNDRNVGTFEHPLATPEKARDVVRLLKDYYENNLKKYSVIFLGGTYKIDTTFTLSAEDGGVEDYPTIYRGEQGKQVVFSGGINIQSEHIVRASPTLPGWHELEIKARNEIRMINLKKLGVINYGSFSRNGFALPLKPAPMELFINNKAMTLARWPNIGFALIDSVIDSSVYIYKNNRLKKWINSPDAWAVGFWRYGWAEYYLPIKSVDTVNYSIALNMEPIPKHTIRHHDITEGNQWFAFNILAELDTSGEYFVDRNSRWLYFIPPANINPESMDISVSMFGEENKPLLEISNANFITIDNITFEKTRSSGIDINGCDNIRIKNCTVQNIGTYGINLNGENCVLEGLNIFDIGANAVTIEGGDRKALTRGNNLIDNCFIHQFGRINFSAVGVTLNGVGNEITNCEIYDAPGQGIRFSGNYLIIEKNNIHDMCGLIEDAGAIYCGREWALYGNIIRNNFIHHIIGNSFVNYITGIHGIYLDDLASGVTVIGNVIYNIRTMGIVNNSGRDNIFENNIIVGCQGANYTNRWGLVRFPSMKDNPLYMQLERLNYSKPPWSTAFPKLAKIFVNGYKDALNPEGCVLKNNVGWKNRLWLNESKLGAPGGFSFYDIQNNLPDTNLNFIDEKSLNLGLKDNSPAYSLPGFKRIPFEEIGVKIK